MRIDIRLEMSQETGGILDFIDNQRGGVSRQKSGWIRLRLLCLTRQIEADVVVRRKKAADERGFPCLSRPREDDHGTVPSPIQHHRFD